MFSDDMPIHRTTTSRITGSEGGWEFFCSECGYHARYILGNTPGEHRLEILDSGDPFARHTGEPPASFWASQNPFGDDLAGMSGGESSMDGAPLGDSPFGEIPVGDASNNAGGSESPELNDIVYGLDETWITPEMLETFERILEKLDQ